MFGLRYRVENLASKIAGLTYMRQVDAEKAEKMEKQLDELTKALEWHIGAPLDVVLAERKLIKLKVAEQKRLIEETGSIELVNQQREGQSHGEPTEVS